VGIATKESKLWLDSTWNYWYAINYSVLISLVKLVRYDLWAVPWKGTHLSTGAHGLGLFSQLFLWWWLTLYQPCNIGDRAVATSTVGPVSTGSFFEAPKLFLAHSTPTDWQLRVQLSSFKINAKMIATHVKASLPGPSDRPPTSQTFLHSSSKLSNSDNGDCAFI